MTTAPTQPGNEIKLYSAGRATLQTSIMLGWARALLGAGAAVIVGSIVDRALLGAPVATPLVWLAVLALARATLSAILPLTSTGTAIEVESDLRRRILDAVLRIGPWSGRRTGETVTKATEGVAAVGALAGTFLPQLIAGMSVPLMLAVVVAVIDWPTALVLLLVLPLIPLMLRLLERRFASVSDRYRETADRLAARFLDGIQGMRTLKTLDQAESYGDHLAEDAERLRGETMDLLRVNQLALLAVDTLFTMGTVVAAAVMAAIRLSVGALTVGEAVTVVLLGVMLIEPLSQIGRYFYVGAIGRASAAQVKVLLDEAATVPLPSASFPAVPGLVEFDRVSFTYPDGTPALEEVSFRVESGERVALVGPSGAGKSTIAHLVLGLLEPGRGSISVGGPAVLVPQRPYLFQGSVADNLRLADPDADDALLWEALESADLTDALQSRRGGLNTEVGERGLRLSGGEVQRLAIARAFLRDASVVVLDEPTSNIDMDSEARLRSAVDRLTVDRTLLVIAHRRSTVAGLERTLVLDQGRLVESVEAGPS